MPLSSARTCGARRCAMLLAGVVLVGELRSTVSFDVFGQSAHGFLGDFDAFTPANRGSCNINGGENLRAATFSIDPKRHCRLHGIFGARKPAALDGLSDKVLLLGSEVYLHAAYVARGCRLIKQGAACHWPPWLPQRRDDPASASSPPCLVPSWRRRRLRPRPGEDRRSKRLWSVLSHRRRPAPTRYGASSVRQPPTTRRDVRHHRP